MGLGFILFLPSAFLTALIIWARAKHRGDGIKTPFELLIRLEITGHKDKLTRRERVALRLVPIVTFFVGWIIPYP